MVGYREVRGKLLRNNIFKFIHSKTFQHPGRKVERSKTELIENDCFSLINVSGEMENRVGTAHCWFHVSGCLRWG